MRSSISAFKVDEELPERDIATGYKVCPKLPEPMRIVRIRIE